MNFKRLSLCSFLSLGVLCSIPALVSCSGKSDAKSDSSSAQTDTVSANPARSVVCRAIDKSGDSTLQAMIKAEVPKFRQFEYKDAATGKTMKYNLFTPKDVKAGKKYPLVLFMADASTPGDDVTRPLSQGYGALVWATQDWQEKNPCYILVPQFSGVAVNDEYGHTDEVDIVIRMLGSVVDANSVDEDRLYVTGQSMGGMISMYYNVAYPDMFAASIFVDSHWDTDSFAELAKHKFIYFIAGDKGKAYMDMKPLEEAAEKDGVQYTFASWSAKLPESRQSQLAAVMLEKGAPVNIFQFEPKTVLPDNGEGSEHMYSFDYAYKIPSVREWLFKQSR